jgi:glycosyltransferase involved in cell wall biosynthesis
MDLVVGTMANAPDPSARVRTVTTCSPGVRSKAVMPFVFLWSLLRVAGARLRGEVDVMHINVAWSGSVYRKAVLARFARALGIPYVIHIHGSRFHETWPSRHMALRRMVDEMLLRSAAILVLGKCWSDHVTKHLPAVRANVRILPNATPARVAPRREGRTGRGLQITFLGLLGERKGSLQLIEALSRLTDLPCWQATIAGNGEISRHKAFAKSLGVAHRIDFPGWLNRASADELLTRTDIFVLPSFAENLPMAILEAFAHGVPVISTPVGAIPDIVEPGVTGLLAPPGDVDALSKALRQLIEAPDLRLAMGSAARQAHAARFDILPYVERLAGIWREAAGANCEAAPKRDSCAIAAGAPMTAIKPGSSGEELEA